MSDNIKKSYNLYMNSEEPSAEFLASLTAKLKQEEERVRTRKKKMFFVRTITIAAACAAVCAAVPLAIHFTKPPVSVDEKPYFGQTDFVNTSSFDSKPLDFAEKKKLNAENLANLLNSSLSELFVSENEIFVDAPTASKSEIQELVAKLSSAKETSDFAQGKKTCYMAVFGDGAIVKFSVFENGVVVIKGTEKNFQ